MAAINACVASEAEISNQVLLATVSSQALTLRMVQGTYDIGATTLSVRNNDVYVQLPSLTILGGYSVGCSSRSVNATNTVFQSSDGSRSLGWLVLSGGVRVEGIHFSGNGTRLFVGPVFDSDTDMRFTLTRNIFSDFVESGSLDFSRVNVSAYKYDGAATIRLENNLFYGNRAENALQIQLIDSDFDVAPAELDVTHNTVVSNEAESGICIVSGAPPRVANNIVRGHDFDLDTACSPAGSGVGVRLFNNHFQTRRGVLPISELGSSTADPGFVSPATLNFRLNASGSAVNTGSTSASVNLPSVDFDGAVRFQGSAPDRGAFENPNTGQFVQTVSNINDSGTGSLRQAILGANGTPGKNLILFNIPGACPRTINLSTALPVISESVSIFAYTQPGSAPNTAHLSDDATRCVIIRPSTAGAIAKGLQVAGNIGSGIQLGVDGLAMGGFSTAAIELVGGEAHFIQGAQFGGSVGAVSLPANGSNIFLGASLGARIGGPDESQRNVIGGATVAGVNLELALDNNIVNNLIGVTPSGTAAIGNAIGIRLNGASQNIIEDNVISGNGNGIVLFSPSGFSASRNIIGNNRIGLRAVPLFGPGGDQLGNEFNGVLIQGSDNVVGSCVHAIDGGAAWSTNLNVIAYNGTTTGAAGIRVGSGRGNCIVNNRMYGNNGVSKQQVDIGAAGIDNPIGDDSDPATNSLSNRSLNAPVLQSVIGGASTGVARVQLKSRNGIYRISIYSRPNGCFAPANFGEPAQGEARDIHVAGFVATISNATANSDGTLTVDIPIRRLGLQIGQGLSARGFVAQVQRAPDPLTEPADTSELGPCREYVDDGTLFRNGFE
jgi:parallel beta-helix repeat protein